MLLKPLHMLHKTIYIKTLITVCLVVIAHQVAVSSTFNSYRISTNVPISDSLQLAFYKGTMQWVKVKGSHKNKYLVQFIGGDFSGKEAKLTKKYIFNKLNHDNELIEEEIRFMFYDNLIADNVVTNGTVLGINKEHFLIEFLYNGKTQITVKHKSEIIQKNRKHK